MRTPTILFISGVAMLAALVLSWDHIGDAPDTAEAATTTTTVSWGPYQVPAASGGTPGMTNNGTDFNVLKPCTDCYITGITPNLVDATGATVNFATGGMLHHMVLFDANGTDVTCGTSGVGVLGERLLASGNERTSFALPDGYGYYIGPGASESWTVLHDIMNMTPTVRDVYLEFEFTYRPGSDNLKPVMPVWLDVDNCAASEYAIPAGYSDETWDWIATAEADVVSIVGHVHDTGISVAAEDVDVGQYICTSVAGYAQGSPFAPVPVPDGDSGHPGSANALNPGDPSYAGHIEDMTGCTPMFRVYQGDTIRLHIQHNSPTAENDMMGIMMAFIHLTTDPTDSDGDGCSDQQENGLDETLGGQRDPFNPWDFYDVAGLSGPTADGEVDLLFDVLGVINHYSPTGAPPYDVQYDRGPTTGPNVWNMTAPDGSIDLMNDILGVIAQHGHHCT